MPPYSELEPSIAEEDGSAVGMAEKLPDDTTLSLSRQSTSSSSISSNSRNRLSESDSPVKRSSAARPRRSRVQSMPAGSNGAHDFFSNPAACTSPPSVRKVSAYRKTTSDGWMISESRDEGEGDKDVGSEKLMVLLPTKNENDNPKLPPSQERTPDIKAGARCQCIIL